MADITKKIVITFEGRDVEFLREIMASWYGRKKQTINLGIINNDAIAEAILMNMNGYEDFLQQNWYETR